MEDKLKTILAKIMEVDPGEIGDDFGPDRCLNWDSLNNLRLITALEKEFAVKLSWPEISSMTDFARIREVIAGRMDGK